MGRVPSDSAPLIISDEVIIKNRDKFEAIARGFYKKLRSPAAPVLGGGRPNADGHPSPSFPGRVEGTRWLITGIKARRATDTLAAGQSSGPDGSAVPDLPSVAPHPSRLMNLVSQSGRGPTALWRMFPGPLPKPAKDPHMADSRCPSALLYAPVEILKTAVFRRIPPRVGPRLSFHLGAFGRERGMEMCLVEMGGAVRRARVRRRRCYVAFFDIAGALDGASHRQ